MSHQTDKDTHKHSRLKQKSLEAYERYLVACDKHGSDSDSAIRALSEHQKFEEHLKRELHKVK